MLVISNSASIACWLDFCERSIDSGDWKIFIRFDTSFFPSQLESENTCAKKIRFEDDTRKVQIDYNIEIDSIAIMTRNGVRQPRPAPVAESLILGAFALTRWGGGCVCKGTDNRGDVFFGRLEFSWVRRVMRGRGLCRWDKLTTGPRPVRHDMNNTAIDP